MIVAGAKRHPSKRSLASALVAALAVGTATPATAQVGGAVSFESDFRLRGYSMSGGRPVATARLGFDHESGVYADGSVTVVVPRDEALQLLGFQVDAGFAKRLGQRWTLDLGVTHNELGPAYAGAPSYDYTEVYTGVTRGPFSAYVFFSPNYFQPGAETIYGQVEATVSPAEDWHVTGHLGSLTYLGSAGDYAVYHKTYYDWRLGVAREFGNAELHAAVSGGGPGRQYYYGELHSRTVVTAGASLSF